MGRGGSPPPHLLALPCPTLGFGSARNGVWGARLRPLRLARMFAFCKLKPQNRRDSSFGKQKGCLSPTVRINVGLEEGGGGCCCGSHHSQFVSASWHPQSGALVPCSLRPAVALGVLGLSGAACRRVRARQRSRCSCVQARGKKQAKEKNGQAGVRGARSCTPANLSGVRAVLVSAADPDGWG